MIKFDFNKIKQKKFLVYDAMSLPGIKLLLKKIIIIFIIIDMKK